MPTTDLLTHATTVALEAMCFTSIIDAVESNSTAAPEIDATWQCAALAFKGEMEGECALAASPDSALSIAANFLGLDPEEVTSAENSDVVCELTNMVAGSVVSGLESSRSFDLTHPEVLAPAALLERFPKADARLFQLEDGYLAVWLRLH